MSIGNVVLSVLGLSPYVAEADTLITASKDAVDLIMASRELLNSEEGKKFREKVEKIVSVTKEKPDGSVHIGSPHPANSPQFARGQYVFDSLDGWVWKPE
jgi:hypothetical protein